jgi:hypothetical protein
MSDKNHQRALGSLQINCLMNDEGCKWKGELSKIDNHLKVCDRMKLSCPYDCGLSIQRQSMENHKQKCDMRLEKCQYCKVFTSNWKEVTTTHYEVCPKVNVTCQFPLCNKVMHREDMEDHITQCTMATVECDFSNVGCKWRGPRDTLSSHLDTDWRKHMSLVTCCNTQMILKQQEEVKKLSLLVTNQGKKLIKQEKQINELTAQLDTLKASRNQQQLSSSLAKSSSVKPIAVKTAINAPPPLQLLDFTIRGFAAAKRSHESIKSQHYVCPPCPLLEVSVYPSGVGKGFGTHVSVFLQIIPGKYDRIISWPYIQDEPIELRLFDHVKHRKSHGKVIVFNCTRDNEASCHKPTPIANCKPVGCEDFITHTEVLRYLFEDQLYFELS